MRRALAARVAELTAEARESLIQLRRELHRHPELGFGEHRSTARVAEYLRAAGIEPTMLSPTGAFCDIGTAGAEGRVLLRADLDALPVRERSGEDFASVNPGMSHSCGHDLHTAIVAGAARVLAGLEREGLLRRGVRALFQPAEEVQPGGARHVMEQGVLGGVSRAFALHCDPRVDVGHLGLKEGPITASSDTLRVTLSSDGGHTSRPHLTGDVVFALGQVITQTSAVLDRRLDPRNGVSLTWGAVHAGSAPNVIPEEGVVTGTIRCLDVAVWEIAGPLAARAIEQLVVPFEVDCVVEHVRGLPPVLNSVAETEILAAAAVEALGEGSVVPTEQSLGGEDFAWFLTEVPGAMGRLGTRTPGGVTYDLHRGDVRFSEDAIELGVRLLALAAVRD
ncbi:MAG TPA: amidohydrolase [Actinomycetaceae bacterium]|nr:amidohydrolase [Actinomycetaceae bacterium]